MTTTLARPKSGTAGSTRTAPDATTTGVTGPRLLTEAAELLPMVIGHGPVISSDVHSALFEAAGRLSAGGRCDRLCLADQSQSEFVAFLVATGEAVWRGRVSRTLHAWLLDQTPASVMHAMAGCGRTTRRVPSGAAASACRS
jgi:hypothetical protein